LKVKIKQLKKIFVLFFAGLIYQSFSQAYLKGQVTDTLGQPLSQVNIQYQQKGTTTDAEGTFILKLPANKKIVVIFSHLNYQQRIIKLSLNPNEIKKIKVVLKPKTEQITEIVIKSAKRQSKEGGIKISQNNIEVTPGAQAGVENLLKSLPSASGYDEMSSQYMVRGGNFDENQVYINGIEIYRPFLIRSGQQEGLSFVNSDLVQNIYFYPGGFAADKGDKLSSVLDITYKKPTSNQTKLSLSLLGGSLANEFKKGKFGSLIGIRYRDNALLVHSKDVQVDYHPRFIDAQTLLRYDFSSKWHTEFLGNLSFNLYDYKPLVKVTKFGSFQDAKVVVINYEGQEKDNYRTYFAALKTTYIPAKNTQYHLIGSLYNTQEEEYYDIAGQYNIGEPNADLGSSDFGNPENLESLGSEIDHARNDLDALIGNIAVNFSQKISDKNQFSGGYKLQIEDIKDRINEWQVIDSAGFSLYPPNIQHGEEPYDTDTLPIYPYQKTKGFNHVRITRHTGFVLWRHQFEINQHQLWANLGLRSQIYTVLNLKNNDHANNYLISPRLIVGYKPDWQPDMQFRLATGIYQQAPFYKEFRRRDGRLNIHVKPQKSFVLSLANDWFFKLWKRPFKLTSEVYYKYLWDVNPYTLENIRIRYFANNKATAFAYGFESRLNGEFIPGVESWFSLALMKTMENIAHRGYIYRPTDQRYKFAMLFQDYVPKMPKMKMYLNLVVNGGIPTGSPSYADPYKYQFRTDSYFRTDLGLFYVFTESKTAPNWRKKIKYLSAGIEILNLFDAQNSISNIWIRDIYSKHMYRIKNYLTGRIVNVKLNLKI